MSLCVVGITLLQLYYSSINYDIAKKEFEKDINEAFSEAVDSTFSLHRQNVVKYFGRWMRDNEKIQVKTAWDEEKQHMVFKFKDVIEEGSPEPREIAFSIETLENKKMGPEEAKEFMVAHLEEEVMYSLKKGIVMYYTQEIGKMLNGLYFEKLLDITTLEREYKKSLKKRGVELAFQLVEDKKGKGDLCTSQLGFGVGFRTESRMVSACFNDIEGYLIGQLKWIIGSTLILIVITLICFWYTLRTLLTQQKLSRMKDDFISNMTHEIHSPISSVIVTAESLKRFEHDDESRESYLDIILYQSQKLALLADEILDGARLDKRGIELTGEIDIAKLLMDTASGYKGKADIEFDLLDGVVVRGSENHLGRAVANILENAVKYNTTETPKIIIKSELSMSSLVISIEDNGPGIPAEYRKKIFSQFYRIPTGNIHNIKGYGLGLSYVRKVVKLHKGEVWVQGNELQGSVFVIRIPYEA